MRTALLSVCLILAACSQPTEQADAEAGAESGAESAPYRPAIGANDIFRTATASAPGHELILTDLLLPADAVGAAHYHPWEEFLYVIEGSAILVMDGMEPRVLQAGETFIIPPQTVHTPTAGPDGIRAIVARVHKEDDPVMIPAGE